MCTGCEKGLILVDQQCVEPVGCTSAHQIFEIDDSYSNVFSSFVCDTCDSGFSKNLDTHECVSCTHRSHPNWVDCDSCKIDLDTNSPTECLSCANGKQTIEHINSFPKNLCRYVLPDNCDSLENHSPVCKHCKTGYFFDATGDCVGCTVPKCEKCSPHELSDGSIIDTCDLCMTPFVKTDVFEDRDLGI